MNPDDSAPTFVRLHVEMMLEISDPTALSDAARRRIADDELMPDAERAPATEAVSAAPAEAVAYLVDPIDLVSGLPGVELAQASWSSEAADHDTTDPDADWFTDDGADH